MRPSIAYLGVVLIWATTPLAIQWGTLDSSFSFAVMSRMVLALICALLLLFLLKIPFVLHARAMRSYLCAGLGLFFAMTCVYWASMRIESGLISVIFGLSPLITSVLAAWWLSENYFSTARLLGMMFGLGGLATIFLDQSLILQPGFAIGLVVLLIGVVCNSMSLVGLKVIADDSHPMVTTAGALLVAAPLFVLLWWVDGSGWPLHFTARGILSIAYLGLIGSVLGFALYYFLITKMSSTSVALILVITPLIALWVGRLFNTEQLPSRVWMGAFLIGFGLWLHHRSPTHAQATDG